MYEEGKRYAAVLIDIPWPWDTWSKKGLGRSPEKYYQTMQIEEICALDFQKLLMPDAAIFMWATCPRIFDAKMVADSWGLWYRTFAFCWVKMNRWKQTPYMGMGKWTRSNVEPCLLFCVGHPKRKAKNVHQVVMAPRGKHSQKPAAIHANIEALVDGPYLEVFAREERCGWDAIGNEIDGRDIRQVLGFKKGTTFNP